MDYLKFIFKNKPSLEEILKTNLFIYGPVGSGKTVIIHQILMDISKLDDLDNYTIYVQEAKTGEYKHQDFPFVKKFFNLCNEEQIITEILNVQTNALDTNKKCLVIFDDIGCSNIEEAIMGAYKKSKESNIVFIIASQLKEVYYRNQGTLEKYGTVWFIEGEYEDKDRSISKIENIELLKQVNVNNMNKNIDEVKEIDFYGIKFRVHSDEWWAREFQREAEKEGLTVAEFRAKYHMDKPLTEEQEEKLYEKYFEQADQNS